MGLEDANSIGQTHHVTGGTFKVRNASDATYDYFGFAKPGSLTSAAVWRIEREEIATGDFDHPNGSGNYDFVWDDATTLDYS